MMFVQVAVPGPFLSPLDYRLLIEPTYDLVGCRVLVPFRKKSLIGLVMSVSEQVDFEESKVKSVESILDEQPIFGDQEMQLLRWAAHYYHEPIGNVVQTALPKRLREAREIEVEGLPAWQLTEQKGAVSGRAKMQKAILDWIRAENSTVTTEQLNEKFDSWRTPLKRLIELGFLVEIEQNCLPKTAKTTRPGHLLNPEQQKAVDEVLKSDGFQCFLLEGVTGSGKTETYLGMIEQVIARGQQVLVLVPEIGLTPQTVARFEAFLQQPVAVMHSALNDKERHCAWWLVKSNQVKVLLGTRSALFAPFADLGLCIMDEEHDLSFKQQEGFRYSARDCLVRRAQLQQVPVVLGTATPSFETLNNALNGRYRHLRLTQRAAGAEMPDICLLDVRGEPIREGVSPALFAKMESHLAAGNQVLLFLNRRGFAPVLMCHQCGWQATCPSCDANMTYHAQFNELRCHHCGYQTKAPKNCPECGANEFVPVGQGTERLENVIRQAFPDKTLLRIDRDTTRNKGEMARLTEQARSGEADILIGTQMLAKGHHFPKVTLVGLLDIDQGLFSVDFRSAERMAQLIVQVAGRAGRAEQKGEVVIQTHHPEHPLLNTLIRQGYEAFARQALVSRKQACLPPFSYAILIRAESVEPEAGWQFLNEAKKSLEAMQELLEFRKGGLDVLGPVSAPMIRRQGRFRYQLWLQSEHRGLLHQILGRVEFQLYASPLSRKVRWSLDVDPQEML